MNFNIKGLGAPKNLGARIAPAGHPSASTDAHAAKTGRKRLSEPVLRAAIRIGDKAIVGASGLVMYLGSAMLHDQALSSRYFSAIAVTIFVAAAVFQWAGVYSGDYLFSRRRRIETLLFAWLGTTVLMISAAFSLGVPDYYSRAWAGNSNNSVTPDPVECGANLDRPARGLGNRADRPLDHAECPGTGNLGGCIVCQPLPVFGHRPPDRLGLKHAPNLRRLTPEKLTPRNIFLAPSAPVVSYARSKLTALTALTMLIIPNRSLTLITIAALALAWVTAAFAQPAPSKRAQRQIQSRGFYVAIGGGGTSFNDLGKRSTGSFEFDPGYLAEASLGYDLGNLRVEGEAHYLATEIDQFSMGATTLNSTGDLQAGGGMLNLYYDFENHSPYTPYVGGGAGLEYVEIDDIIVGGVGLGGRRGAVLGWQASGGFSYRINRGYGVGLGYRFTVFEGEIDTEAHRILLSARRYF